MFKKEKTKKKNHKTHTHTLRGFRGLNWKKHLKTSWPQTTSNQKYLRIFYLYEFYYIFC